MEDFNRANRQLRTLHHFMDVLTDHLGYPTAESRLDVKEAAEAVNYHYRDIMNDPAHLEERLRLLEENDEAE